MPVKPYSDQQIDQLMEHLYVEKGSIKQVPLIVANLTLGKRALILCDTNTHKVAGDVVMEHLEKAGCEAFTLVYRRKGELVADELAVGEAVLALLKASPDFLVSVGSGTLTDITRSVAKLNEIPFLVVPTAPSMDGYASGVAPLITYGAKQTFPAKAPVAIVADLDILSSCPARMVQAGLGDLLGKITAKADWLLSHLLNGEQYCEQAQGLVDQAVTLVKNSVRQGKMNSSTFLAELTKGLVLSGVAISLVGSSRPASGSEHHLSHYWEMLGLRENKTMPLHGQKVGYATFLILKLYEKVIDRVISGEDLKLKEIFSQVARVLISSEEYRELLIKAEVPLGYQELGLSKEWVMKALLEGMHVRKRYTILRFASEQKWLPELTREIMDEIG